MPSLPPPSDHQDILREALQACLRKAECRDGLDLAFSERLAVIADLATSALRKAGAIQGTK